MSTSPHRAVGGTPWSYRGETGPEYWGQLNPEWHACRFGRTQSPINIATAELVANPSLPQLEIAYGDVGAGTGNSAKIANTGHTVQVDYPAGCGILSLGSDLYELVQFHFHGPSEHTIDGQHFTMEGHFVHRSQTDGLLVLGVLYRAGKRSRLMGQLVDVTPKHIGAVRPAFPFNAGDLLPKGRGYYTYTGSLTTPPCSEGVTWIITCEPATVSTLQVYDLRTLLGGKTNRPVQPLSGRTVQQRP